MVGSSLRRSDGLHFTCYFKRLSDLVRRVRADSDSQRALRDGTRSGGDCEDIIVGEMCGSNSWHCLESG